MTNISAQMVKELRERTGAGMMDCKGALNETAGDMEQAIDLLRKKGLARAAKKAGRVAAEGLIAVATKDSQGVLVEVNSETDFVARNDLFQGLVKMIANVALATGTDVDRLKSAKIGNLTVSEAISDTIAKIGENISLRRASGLSPSVRDRIRGDGRWGPHSGGPTRRGGARGGPGPKRRIRLDWPPRPPTGAS